MSRIKFILILLGIACLLAFTSLSCVHWQRISQREKEWEQTFVKIEKKRATNLAWHYGQELFSMAVWADNHQYSKLSARLFAKASDLDPKWSLPAIEAAIRIPAAENDIPKALKYAKRAISHDPKNPRAYEIYTQLLLDSNNCPTAYKQAKKGIELKGSNLTLHILFAKSAMCMKDYATAENELNFLISKQNENSSYYLLLAKVYENEGRFKKAENIYKKAIDKFGKNRVFLSELYSFYVRIGDKKKAYKTKTELESILPKPERKKMRPLRPSRR